MSRVKYHSPMCHPTNRTSERTCQLMVMTQQGIVATKRKQQKRFWPKGREEHSPMGKGDPSTKGRGGPHP